MPSSRLKGLAPARSAPVLTAPAVLIGGRDGQRNVHPDPTRSEYSFPFLFSVLDSLPSELSFIHCRKSSNIHQRDGVTIPASLLTKVRAPLPRFRQPPARSRRRRPSRRQSSQGRHVPPPGKASAAATTPAERPPSGPFNSRPARAAPRPREVAIDAGNRRRSTTRSADSSSVSNPRTQNTYRIISGTMSFGSGDFARPRHIGAAWYVPRPIKLLNRKASTRHLGRRESWTSEAQLVRRHPALLPATSR